MKIKNMEELLSHGDSLSRRVLLDLTERVLEKLDAYKRIKQIIRREGEILYLGHSRIDLSERKHIYLLGAGKACNAMAQAICDVLGKYITKGIISVKISEPHDQFVNTDVFIGGHPIPNMESYKATEAMINLINTAEEGDLFICVVSGGSSALLGGTVAGITEDDEALTSEVLLKCGADIVEINSIRRHISKANGGRLAQRIDRKRADMICFAIRDSLFSGPTGDILVPCDSYPATPFGSDSTTLEDARNTINKYCLEDKLPSSVVNFLMSADSSHETPKSFNSFKYFIINSVPDSTLIAERCAEEMGISSLILTSYLEGEARELGKVMASIAREIKYFGHPMKAPCVVISAGEAYTKITSKPKGHGGPGQEMTLAFAEGAQHVPGCALLSIDTEGTDGTTPIAGGLTDSQTFFEAKQAGVNIQEALDTHASYEAISLLHCGVQTGNTGTNVCDLNLMYVSGNYDQGV